MAEMRRRGTMTSRAVRSLNSSTLRIISAGSWAMARGVEKAGGERSVREHGAEHRGQGLEGRGGTEARGRENAFRDPAVEHRGDADRDDAADEPPGKDAVPLLHEAAKGIAHEAL